MQTTYTILEAARALGVDKRTLQRRVKNGALSAVLTQRGRQQVRVIDGAELARFAQAEGYDLRAPEGATTVPTAGDNQGASDSRSGAECPSCMVLRATVEAQERLVAVLEGEVRYLREQVSQLTTRLLPPAPEEQVRRPSWWERLTGKGGSA